MAANRATTIASIGARSIPTSRAALDPECHELSGEEVAAATLGRATELHGAVEDAAYRRALDGGTIEDAGDRGARDGGAGGDAGDGDQGARDAGMGGDDAKRLPEPQDWQAVA